ncbi:Fc.00g005020.m01.CDS01 [Cosmosporella sp. VM-42]
MTSSNTTISTRACDTSLKILWKQYDAAWNDKNPPTRLIGKGLEKSNSSASVSSIKSHTSIRAIGVYPLGSLRIHRAEDSMSQSTLREGDDEDGPPPLDPPTGVCANTSRRQSKISVRSGASSPTKQHLTHNLGGGDVVMILGLPEVFTIGYDSVSFAAKHFGGIRDIPRGTHFFWVSQPNNASTRFGFWIVATGVDAVHVAQWDWFNEVLCEPSRAEARFQTENLAEKHQKLIPFSQPEAVNGADGDKGSATVSEKHFRMWENLTGCITPTVLNRLTGEHCENWIVHTGDLVRGAIRDDSEFKLDSELLNPLKAQELRFSASQQAKTFSTDQTGEDRTLKARDSTPYLLALFRKRPDDDELTHEDLIGEFQFAFIVGVHLGNDSCIQQWWHMLLKLFLRAYLLPITYPDLATTFVETLTAQITYSTDWLEESILDYSESPKKDLRLALTVYNRRLHECFETVPLRQVKYAFRKLELVADEALGWDLRGDYLRRGNVMMEDGEQVELEVTDLEAEDERGEYAPEVVDMDENGKQRDLVSFN